MRPARRQLSAAAVVLLALLATSGCEKLPDDAASAGEGPVADTPAPTAPTTDPADPAAGPATDDPTATPTATATDDATHATAAEETTEPAADGSAGPGGVGHGDTPEPAEAPAFAAGPFVYPAPGGSPGPGTLPARAASVEYLGAQDYGTPVARDLGFSGVLDGRSVWTYGDTLVPDGKDGWQITANDSVGLGDPENPLRIDQRTAGDGRPDQWIPLTPEEEADGGLGRYGMGGTNVVEPAPGQGLVWFLRNNRGEGGGGIEGAGVATVALDDDGVPHATRTGDVMWGSDEPWWGDIGATYDPQDGFVYVYGHGPEGTPGSHVYLARVPADRATDVGAYSYWDDGAGEWTDQRFTRDGADGTRKITGDEAIFGERVLGQSNAFWSSYYDAWMFVAGADYGYTDVMVMTAPRLEGPWTEMTTVASTCPTGTCGSMRYAIAPHPEYDPTGRTLLVSWTDDNVVHSSRITWE